MQRSPSSPPGLQPVPAADFPLGWRELWGGSAPLPGSSSWIMQLPKSSNRIRSSRVRRDHAQDEKKVHYLMIDIHSEITQDMMDTSTRPLHPSEGPKGRGNGVLYAHKPTPNPHTCSCVGGSTAPVAALMWKLGPRMSPGGEVPEPASETAKVFPRRLAVEPGAPFGVAEDDEPVERFRLLGAGDVKCIEVYCLQLGEYVFVFLTLEKP